MDIAPLLEPLPGDDPIGPNLRSIAGDETFRQLEHLRQEYEAATSPSGEEKEADWRGVVRLASQALLEKSKDLELVVVLAEGLAHVEGFGGLRDGLRLALGLLQRYWKRLHPGRSDDGQLLLAVHFKPLSAMGSSREFLTAIQKIPIIQRASAPPLGWFEFQMARRSPGGVDEASRLAERSRYDAYLAQGFVTSADWRAALRASPVEDLRRLATELLECRAALAELMQFFLDKTKPETTPDEADRIAEDETPNFLRLRDLIDDLSEELGKTAPGEPEAAGDEAAVGQAEGGGAASAPGAAGAAAPRGLQSRADAFRQLREVAEYLRRTDPHSPVACLVQRAVRWGDMPLDQLLAEVLHNDDALARVRDTLGLQGETGG